jgi:hypothetical protein
MFTSNILVLYFLIVTSTTTIALIWRTLLLDHPRLLAVVESIPLLGGALRCGFCAAIWLSLAAVLWHNPLTSAVTQFSFISGLAISWLAVSAGVLFLRNLIAVLMEGAGVLTGLHRQQH